MVPSSRRSSSERTEGLGPSNAWVAFEMLLEAVVRKLAGWEPQQGKDRQQRHVNHDEGSRGENTTNVKTEPVKGGDMPPQRPWVFIVSGVFAAGFACRVVSTLARTPVYRFEHVRLGQADLPPPSQPHNRRCRAYRSAGSRGELRAVGDTVARPSAYPNFLNFRQSPDV
jgi:hypothetical protein